MATIEKTTVVRDAPVIQTSTVRRIDSYSYINRLVYFIFSILNVLLIARFVFLAVGANRVGIIDFLYSITQPFVAPFIGVFNTTTIYGVGYVEWVTILAILFYAFIAWLIVTLIEILSQRIR